MGDGAEEALINEIADVIRDSGSINDTTMTEECVINIAAEMDQLLTRREERISAADRRENSVKLTRCWNDLHEALAALTEERRGNDRGKQF